MAVPAGRHSLSTADMIMPHAAARSGDSALRNRCDLIILDAEFEVDGTLHRGAVLRLDEKDARLRFSTGRRIRSLSRAAARNESSHAWWTLLASFY